MGNDQLGFRWLGVAGLEVQLNNEILLIDPFLSRPNLGQILFYPLTSDGRLLAERLPRCDHILVTHAHYDHLMDVPAIVEMTNATVYGSPNTYQLLEICGVPKNQLKMISPQDHFQAGSYLIQTLPAKHLSIPGFKAGPLTPDLKSPLKAKDYRMDFCYSFLIQAGAVRLLDWRSENGGNAVPAEVLFVGPVGSQSNFNFLINTVQPKIVIPVHWDNFLRPLSKPIQAFPRCPGWLFASSQRENLSNWIEQISPHTQVVIPDIFSLYNLKAYLDA